MRILLLFSAVVWSVDVLTEKGGREVIEADEVAGGVVPQVAQLLGLFDEVGGMDGSLEVDPEFTRGVRFVLNLEA